MKSVFAISRTGRLRLIVPSLLLLWIVAGFAGTSARAQDPLGGLVLGAGLDKFAGNLQTLVDKALAGGQLLEIGAGGQVAVAITNARVAYEADLNLTYSKLNAGEQQTVNSLSSLLTAFENKTYADVADLEGRALAITHSLPFSKTLPRLFSYSPGFVAKQADNAIVSLLLDGDFTDLVRKGLESYLFINGTSIENKEKGNGLISFDIPFKMLSSAPNRVSTTLLTIHIPYKQTCYLVLSCDKIAEFRMPLAVLPLSAGVVTISYKTTQPGTDTRQHACTPTSQESVDNDIKCDGENAQQAIHTCSPDPGYQLDPNTVTHHWTPNTTNQGKEGKSGDYWLERNCSSATTACECWSTEHHRTGTSGKVYFYLTFTEFKPINIDIPGLQTVNLGWSDNQVVTLPLAATWSGSYKRFDGKMVTFAGPYSDSYVHITQTANVINLATIP